MNISQLIQHAEESSLHANVAPQLLQLTLQPIAGLTCWMVEQNIKQISFKRETAANIGEYSLQMSLDGDVHTIRLHHPLTDA